MSSLGGHSITNIAKVLIENSGVNISEKDAVKLLETLQNIGGDSLQTIIDKIPKSTRRGIPEKTPRELEVILRKDLDKKMKRVDMCRGAPYGTTATELHAHNRYRGLNRLSVDELEDSLSWLNSKYGHYLVYDSEGGVPPCVREP